MPASKLREYAANNIYFYKKDDECTPGDGNNVSSICGDTAREKYWSVLRSIGLSNIQIAGIFGSADHEGFFGPTLWQYNIVPQGSGQFAAGKTWDRLYANQCPRNDGTIGACGGIGAFQNTTWLSDFLHAVNDEQPDLLKYYKDASYSLPGDEALKKIGAKDFDRLVEMDVKKTTLEYRKDVTEKIKTINDVGEAADYWTKEYENCACCGGSYALQYNGGCSSQLEIRRKSAYEEYEIIKKFSCSGSSSSDDSDSDDDSSDSNDSSDSSDSDTTIAGSKKSKKSKKSDNSDDSTSSDDSDSSNKNTSAEDGITWIGDSYSVGANNKGLISKNFSDVDFGPGNPDSSSSYIKVGKFVSSSPSGNPSCLEILKKVINDNKLRANLIFACGTNGGWTNDDVRKFKNLIKDQNVRVVVVNSKTPKNDYTESNKLLKELADENDNIALADWVSVYNADYFASDNEKIHPFDDPGYEKWVGAIADALGNAKNGCSTGSYKGEYPEYIQQTNHTCGPASMAMLATVAANKDVSEADVISIIGNDRAYAATSDAGMTALDQKVGEKYGFTAVDVPYSSYKDAEEKMKKYLDDGYMLHFSGKGSYPFTPGGHYVGIFGWTDKDKGKVMIADSNKGNKELSLHDVIHAGLHYTSFSAIKGSGSSGTKCNDSGSGTCPSDGDSDSAGGTCSAKVLNTVKDLIELAKKNGSKYPRGADGKSTGGIRDAAGFKSILKDNALMLVDCTGFASLVMYSAFGVTESFWTGSIAGNSNYKEVSKSDIQPGDIFNYNDSTNCSAHGGIIIETKGNKITKIAQTGRADYITEGWGGKNENIGYTNDPNGVNGNLQCVNNAPDVKYYRYKDCN